MCHNTTCISSAACARIYKDVAAPCLSSLVASPSPRPFGTRTWILCLLLTRVEQQLLLLECGEGLAMGGSAVSPLERSNPDVGYEASKRRRPSWERIAQTPRARVIHSKILIKTRDNEGREADIKMGCENEVNRADRRIHSDVLMRRGGGRKISPSSHTSFSGK